jgi:asparagine synthetase B (glutamine-hydrolysing)
MVSDNGRWLILFNGEVYNFIELGEELGFSNCKNYSDTKIILEQFSKFGIKALFDPYLYISYVINLVKLKYLLIIYEILSLLL